MMSTYYTQEPDYEYTYEWEDYADPREFEDGKPLMLSKEDALYTLYEELFLGATVDKKNIQNALVSLADHCRAFDLSLMIAGARTKDMLTEYVHVGSKWAALQKRDVDGK